ncbi:DUF1524 domain-containing protein [Bdellovibrio sp. HCB337]|uniref:GmrSD restriction endonuclease domain-containing protein n=1 Tax=Bdellovibrio sp. HCB337 TaxID=3394358 RepID=UPI0039A553C7
MTKQLILFKIILASSLSASAWAPDYYTVQDQNAKIQEASMNPLETFSEVVEVAARRKIADLNLMAWDHHEEELEDPATPYNRKSQYGTWVRDRNDGTCYNTRAKVLIRSSEIPVSFASNGCTVKNGLWNDPYSNRQYRDAADIQIDHVVALKNSYVSGGWKWNANKRCLYANFMSNEYHLMAVNGPDNMKKGDRTPEKFMPPNAAYACEYLKIWLKIKLIWNLAMTPSEADAISDLAKQHQCQAADLVMTAQELSQQRQGILDNMGLCKAAQ